jgi:hypothetical protein
MHDAYAVADFDRLADSNSLWELSSGPSSRRAPVEEPLCMIVLDNLSEFAHHFSHFSLSSNFAD